MRRARAIVPLLLAVLAMAGLFAWLHAIGGPHVLRERYGTKGILVSLIVHWALNLSPAGEIIPMGVANGAMWGPWIGAAVNWVGWTGASVTQYLLVRRLGVRYNLEARLAARLERAPSWLRRLPVGHPSFQIFGRFVPYVGMHLVNILSAVRRVPPGRFVLFAILGLGPPAVAMAAIGNGLVAVV